MLVVKKSKGFSLIELMIVVSIIGIIAAVGIPSYQANIKKGRASTAQGDLLSLAQKVEQYKTGNFSYSGATAAGVYSAGSPTGAATPHFILFVEVLNAGRAYRLSATANPASPEAKNDGTYWYNPQGKNCYFENGGGYSASCAGGTEW